MKACPFCKGRATKLVSLSTGLTTCQQCGRDYYGGADPSARVWPISIRCLIVGCFYPAGDRCAFCDEPRPVRPLGSSPLSDLLKRGHHHG